MKNKKIILFLITILTVTACMATTVFAEEPPLDFSEMNEDTTNSENEEEETTDLSNQITGGTNTNTEDKKEETTDTKTENKVEDKKEEIPYAGPVENALMVSAFIVCGIVGIYTFVKMSDYSNI